MAWQDTIQGTASFRGVSFTVETEAGTYGRRSVVHNKPKGELPYVEDMGRRDREFVVDGYIVGDDYTRTEKRIIAAAETAGAGELIHPVHGRMMVTCTALRTRHSTREGRRVLLSFSFVESGRAVIRGEVADNTAEKTKAEADTALEQATESFTAVYAVLGKPQHYIDAAVSTLQAVGDTIRSVKTRAAAAPSVQSAYAKLSSEANVLALSASDLAETLLGTVGATSGDYATFDRLNDSLRLMDQLSSRVTSVSSDTTEDANTTAIWRLAYQGAIIEAARASADATYDSYDDALRTANQIASTIDMLVETTDVTDEYFAQLTALRAAVVLDIRERAARAPRVLSYRLGAPLPTVVIGHDLYEDAQRGAEIGDRNGVVHPSFVPAGVDLEVLSRV